MKTQLSIQEKLWELRKERNLNLEDVAKAEESFETNKAKKEKEKAEFEAMGMEWMSRRSRDPFDEELVGWPFIN